MSVIIRALKRFYDENKMFFVISSLFFIVSIVFGALYYVNISEQSKSEVLKYFESIREVSDFDFISGFKIISSRYIFYAVFMWLCGLTALGSVLSVIPIVLHGFSASFCVSAFYSLYGGRGIITALASVIPGCIMTLPVMLVFCAYSMRCSLQYSLKIKGSGIMRYTVLSALLASVFLAGAFFDSFISSYVMINMF